MRKIERTLTVFASPEEAAREELRRDEALTPEERLQTAWELSVLAHGPPSRFQRVHRMLSRPEGCDKP